MSFSDRDEALLGRQGTGDFLLGLVIEPGGERTRTAADGAFVVKNVPCRWADALKILPDQPFIRISTETLRIQTLSIEEAR